MLRANNSKLIASVLAPLFISACSGDLDPGELTIAVYGEAFIEDGIPADELVDDWAITFDRFLVSVGEVTAAEGDGGVALEMSSYQIVNLAQPSSGEGVTLARGDVDGGFYDNVGYRIAGSSSASGLNASVEDVSLMTSGGYAVFVAGSATKGNVTKTFEWGFTTPTRYGRCEGTAEIDGSMGRLELTIHGDHLFYDDLVSSEPNVAFDLIAAADDSGDGDGAVTMAELAAVDISGEARYQVGNFAILDLWSFLDQQVSTVGHIDGEGHCNDAVRE